MAEIDIELQKKLNKLKASRTFLELKDALTFTNEERKTLNSNNLENIYKTVDKKNPFSVACKMRNFWLAKFYHKRGICQSKEKELIYFSKKNETEGIKFILSLGVIEKHAMDKAFCDACGRRNKIILQLLIEHGYKFDEKKFNINAWWCIYPSHETEHEFKKDYKSEVNFTGREMFNFLVEIGYKDKNYKILKGMISSILYEREKWRENTINPTFVKNLIYNSTFYNKKTALRKIATYCRNRRKRFTEYYDESDTLLKLKILLEPEDYKIVEG